MRFLFFNLAVVAALFYLFSADHGTPSLGKDLREDPLQAIRQQLESLARDIADGRGSPDQTKDVAKSQQPESADTAPEEPEDRPTAAASTQADAATAAQDAVRAETEAPQTLADSQRQGPAAADQIGPLPEVDDPAVALRRAEVLSGVAPLDEGRAEAAVEPGPPMGPEERLRKLYSLAEEMELLYVSKMTR